MRNETRDIAAPISDLSSPDSPLRISGRVLFHEVLTKDTYTERYNIDGDIRDISLKPVVAFNVSVSMLPEYDGGVKQEFQIDYFFDRDVLEPGSPVSMSDQTPGTDTGPYHGEAPVRAAHAEAQVLFVQFLDGSTFGKSAWGDSLGNGRAAQIGLLHSLLEAYEKGGATGLSSAIPEGLAKPNRPKPVDAMLRQIDDDFRSRGAEATVDEIRDFLANAQARERLLDPN